MNLTDLRDELDTRALEIDQPTADVTLSVTRKIQQIKRRRSAAVAGACVAALLSGGLVVGNALSDKTIPIPAGPSRTTPQEPMIGTDGMPYRAVPDGPGDVIKDGLRYRAKVADDTLAAAAIGDVGQSRVTLTWKVTTKHLSFGAACLMTADSDSPLRTAYRVTINGKTWTQSPKSDGFRVFGDNCQNHGSSRDLPASRVIFGEPGLTDLVVGSSATVSIERIAPKTVEPVPAGEARLTVAVYNRGGQQALPDAAGKVATVVPEAIEHQGYVYRLTGDVATKPSVTVGTLQFDTPVGKPFIVGWGHITPATFDAARIPPLRVEGLAQGGGVTGAGISATTPQPARGPGHVRLVRDEPTQGTDYLVIYALDGPAD